VRVGVTATLTLERSINRYYDPATDQFLSVDPLVDQTGQPYEYVNDNPLNATDPLGVLACSGGHALHECFKVVPTLKVVVYAYPTPKSGITSTASSGGQPTTVQIDTQFTDAYGVTYDQEFVYHYTSASNAKSIMDGGFIVPKDEAGEIYVSPTLYPTATDAQNALSIPNVPEGYFQIPIARVSGLTEYTVAVPQYGFDGGGLEASTTEPIDADGLDFVPLE